MNNLRLTQIQHLPELARQAKWSVTRLAKSSGVSVRTLERHFRETYGETPKAWLVEQRHKQALKLLRAGASVKEAAARIGYRHATTFAREFKKFFGEYPQVLAAGKESRLLVSKCRVKLRHCRV
jgi:AraC-like DNA-binding protein